MKEFNVVILKEKKNSRKHLILTRTPLGPGLPCGPAEPYKEKQGDFVDYKASDVHRSAEISVHYCGCVLLVKFSIEH